MSSQNPKKAPRDARTSAPRPRYTLRWGRRELTLGRRTALMGIVNVTPDSFSDGGQHFETRAAVNHCLRLAADGADIVDIGGESTRPGAPDIPADEETRRIVPVIETAARQLDVPISVDTSKPDVARAALDAGAAMINDITAGGDPQMFELAAQRGVPIVLMHMQGTPRTMQLDPHYDDVVAEIAAFLTARLDTAVHAGVPRDHVILDPGIGFGKTVKHNFEIIKRLPELNALGCPLLVGPSRKSFIGKTLGVETGQRLMGTAAAIAACVLGGAHMVRVHDVTEMRQVCDLLDALRAPAGENNG